MNKRKIGILIAVIVVVISVVIIADSTINKDSSIISRITTSKDKDKDSEATTENNKGSNSDESVRHVSSNPNGENGSYNFYHGSEDIKVNKDELPYKLPDKTTLTIEKIGQYTGQFLEDGKDEAVENIFAIIVKNNADQMLQYAEIKFDINGEEANFIVTNLPAKKSALALEFNKKSFSKNSNISYKETLTSYIDNNSMNTDKFNIEDDNTILTLKNLTNKSYSTVYVYYKNVDEDGSYLGGITYRTKFENVKANSTVSADTEHYLEGASEIVMVDCIE